MERFGIDAYEYDGSKINRAYQFKGFEVKSISNSQIKQIEKSIKSFSKRTEIIKEYLIVVNQFIMDQSFVSQLKDYFNSFDSNIDVKFEFHDLNSFFNILYDKYESFMNDNIWYYNSIIANWIRESMQQEFYHEEVPFYYENSSIHNNPTNLLKQKLSRTKSSSNPDSTWFFITSEFGYGKTSLASRLVEVLKENSINSIYVPVSNLSNDSFSNFTNLSREILEEVLMIQNINPGKDSLEFGLLSYIFKKHLSHNNNLVLIFDGLDEHRHCYSLNTINVLFKSWKAIKSDIVILLRKEFWEDRNYELVNNIPSSVNSTELIELTEWDDKTILNFCNRINDRSENIRQFISLVQSNGYTEVYGDIPKRPLFLKMLLDDIRNNNKSENISSLYLNYFIRKFKQDHSGYEHITPKRPELGNLGFIDSTKILLKIMGEVSLSMYDFSTNMMEESIESTVVLEIGNKHGVKEIIQITLNSILVPSTSNNFREYKIRFAHKSYQEFFTAYELLNSIKSQTFKDKYNVEYNLNIKKFFNQLMQTEELKTGELIQQDKNLKILAQRITTPNNI